MITYKITFMDGTSTRYECQSNSDISETYDLEDIYKIERVFPNGDLQRALNFLKANCVNHCGCEGCYFDKSGVCRMLATLKE